MLELTNAQIGGWIASFVLPLFRVAAPVGRITARGYPP